MGVWDSPQKKKIEQEIKKSRVQHHCRKTVRELFVVTSKHFWVCLPNPTPPIMQMASSSSPLFSKRKRKTDKSPASISLLPLNGRCKNSSSSAVFFPAVNVFLSKHFKRRRLLSCLLPPLKKSKSVAPVEI